ncbi:Acyl-CoA-binding protein ACBP [Perkinsela sp. CCAP 1560/4]|nr:Acyl-CoA-binding protein ACBP [Perkinsela sp. CCAP 1560/4]KNH08172.1 Acyl-CoA-binding protein ACBP [Perkinsela sp. CCAP 1560/4]|eukprot:KNH00562.1 Acyl-CoA-binding protein ACBP [Perkinsela sp. CCAP 1560/4]
MTTLEQEFQRAVEFVRTPNSEHTIDFDSAVKLLFYGLYKQATAGDCNTSQPWAISFEARAKWDAWNNLHGMTREDAMEKYVQELRARVPTYA